MCYVLKNCLCYVLCKTPWGAPLLALYTEIYKYWLHKIGHLWYYYLQKFLIFLFCSWKNICLHWYVSVARVSKIIQITITFSLHRYHLQESHFHHWGTVVSHVANPLPQTHTCTHPHTYARTYAQTHTHICTDSDLRWRFNCSKKRYLHDHPVVAMVTVDMADDLVTAYCLMLFIFFFFSEKLSVFW